MSEMSAPPKGRIRRVYHPAHGGHEPLPEPKRPGRFRPDPAPSRWAYRMQRLMLTPLFRQLLLLGLPLAIVLGAGGLWFADEAHRAQINDAIADMRAAIEERDEFMVNAMAIDGAGAEVSEDIREILPVDFPISSFHLDLDHMRQTIAGLDAVEGVGLRIRPGGVLDITVKERLPVVVWRSSRGLELLDAGGYRVAPVAARTDRADLPVIAGTGADMHVREALRVIATARPLHPRLRGLERIGARRWDLVLDRNQRVLLPAENPVRAMSRVLALEAITPDGMLDRDIAVVDMRLQDRPTVRMTKHAVEELRRRNSPELGMETQ